MTVETSGLIDLPRLADLCRRRGIRRLSLFGSALRGELGPFSDVDLLVEFEPGRTLGLAFFDLQDELTTLIGRTVDLNTPGWLSPEFRAAVVREAEVLYESLQSRPNCNITGV